MTAGPPRSNRVPDGYKASGVDLAEADAGLRNIIARVTATWPKTGFGVVQLPIGYFANIVDIGGIGLALCTDGVGSKAIVAQMMGQYDTIGKNRVEEIGVDEGKAQHGHGLTGQTQRQFSPVTRVTHVASSNRRIYNISQILLRPAS